MTEPEKQSLVDSLLLINDALRVRQLSPETSTTIKLRAVIWFIVSTPAAQLHDEAIYNQLQVVLSEDFTT